jgi:hypothetical protein
MRPDSMTSNGGANTFAPSDAARFAASSALATVMYVPQCGGTLLLGAACTRRRRTPALLEHRMLGRTVGWSSGPIQTGTKNATALF